MLTCTFWIITKMIKNGGGLVLLECFRFWKIFTLLSRPSGAPHIDVSHRWASVRIPPLQKKEQICKGLRTLSLRSEPRLDTYLWGSTSYLPLSWSVSSPHESLPCPCNPEHSFEGPFLGSPEQHCQSCVEVFGWSYLSYFSWNWHFWSEVTGNLNGPREPPRCQTHHQSGTPVDLKSMLNPTGKILFFT